jgi:hypothetical protein
MIWMSGYSTCRNSCPTHLSRSGMSSGHDTLGEIIPLSWYAGQDSEACQLVCAPAYNPSAGPPLRTLEPACSLSLPTRGRQSPRTHTSNALCNSFEQHVHDGFGAKQRSCFSTRSAPTAILRKRVACLFWLESKSSFSVCGGVSRCT